MRRNYFYMSTCCNKICLGVLVFSFSLLIVSCRKMESNLKVSSGVVISNEKYPGAVLLRSVAKETLDILEQTGKFPDNPKISSCTGSIISSNTILTAAHCTKGDEKFIRFVEISEDKQVVVIGTVYNKFFKHSKDGKTDTNNAKYDMAVWIFKDGSFDDVKEKLQISDIKPKLKDVGRMVGFGCYTKFQRTKDKQGRPVTNVVCDGDKPKEKRTGTNQISYVENDLSYIKLSSKETIVDSVSQEATGLGTQAAPGDSGGPLLLESDPTKILGVASYIGGENNYNYDKCKLVYGEEVNNSYNNYYGCNLLNSVYINPVSSYNKDFLQRVVDNTNAIIPGIQVGIGVIEYNGKIKVLYKDTETTFNQNVEEHKVITYFNGRKYSTIDSLKQAWRSTNFYSRSLAKWSFE